MITSEQIASGQSLEIQCELPDNLVPIESYDISNRGPMVIDGIRYSTSVADALYRYIDPTQFINVKCRGFNRIKGFEDTPLPTRATKYSCGYDLAVTEDIDLLPGEIKIYTTGLCAYMLSDEVLKIHIRSSIGIYKGVILSNSTSIIDSDYIQSDNGGHIMIALTNTGTESFHADKGDRVAQGIFHKYLVSDDDNVTKERNGGWGSTGV